MKEDLTVYDVKPKEFINYLRYYGEHFNKKLCEFACEELEYDSYDKESVKTLFKSYGIEIKTSQLYDMIFLTNYAKAKYYGKGISDEKNLVMFVKASLEEGSDLVFAKFLAEVAKKGILIEWEEMV